jgi:hypothetical protein
MRCGAVAGKLKNRPGGLVAGCRFFRSKTLNPKHQTAAKLRRFRSCPPPATPHAGLVSHPSPSPAPPREATRLSEINPQQWKSGLAAWFGWMFDGMELHLYTLVATPLVIELLHTTANDPAVNQKKAYIQAAFLLGWALGGAFFGRLGDRLGRSRTLALTVLTYAFCTGLCALAQTWWQLMLFRFVAALGIGGEWAVGASLLAETWPKAWRPWLAAVLQSGGQLRHPIRRRSHLAAGRPRAAAAGHGALGISHRRATRIHGLLDP